MLGELAALGTSLCWSATSTFFTLGGRLVGSVVVNRVRLALAVGFLTLAHGLLGMPLPWGVGGERWFWLTLSGILGLVLGDAFLFQAFVWVGPRLSMLIMTLVPVISTALAWVFLAERLDFREIVGVIVTVVGVAWVVWDQGRTTSDGRPRHRYWSGLAFAFAGAVGQASGLITAKLGLAGGFSPLSATWIRMFTAALIMWGAAVVTRQAWVTVQRLWANGLAMRYILAGAFFGPFLGVTLSLVAVQNAQVGVASALMSLPPIFLLPIGRLVFKERITLGGVVGAVVAVAGAIILTVG